MCKEAETSRWSSLDFDFVITVIRGEAKEGKGRKNDETRHRLIICFGQSKQGVLEIFVHLPPGNTIANQKARWQAGMMFTLWSFEERARDSFSGITWRLGHLYIYHELRHTTSRLELDGKLH